MTTTTPTVHYVTPHSPHSPLYHHHPDRLFIDGVAYQGGVSEYMQARGLGPEHLLEAMMHKYTQNIHLQKIFQDDDDDVVIVHENVYQGPPPPWLDVVRLNTEIYPELRRRFRKINDVATYEDMLGVGACPVEQIEYIRRAQPALGIDAALEVSKLWIEKKRTHVRYHVDIEDELALYVVPQRV
jgi:hypothetical protein